MMSFGAIIIVIASRQLGKGMVVGEVISMTVFFVAFVGMLNNAFMKIMFFSRNYQLGQDAIDRLEDIFAKMEKNKLESGSIEKMDSYDIEFENVGFKYEEGVNVLSDFNLKLEAGKVYALVGSSGSGKSTIAKLISGFYPVSSCQL